MRKERYNQLLDTLDSDARGRVSTFLRRVDEGFDTNIMTPFFPKEFTEENYGRYVQVLSETDFATVNEIEADEAAKFGPFSLRAPYGDRRELVYEYFSQAGFTGDYGRLLKAFDKVSLLVSSPLNALSLEEAYQQMPNGTNLGLPFFSRQDEFRVEYLNRAKSFDKAGYEGCHLYPAIIGWRGQPKGKYPKQRTVWMMDHVETIIGLSIQIPVLQALRGKDEFVAWNDLGTVDSYITDVISNAKQPIISADFSGYDMNLSYDLVHLSFDLLRNWFTPKWHKRLDFLESEFLHVGLLTPEGILEGREAGVPSGSALTNLIDSLAQLLFWHYVLEDNIQFITVLGDDGVVVPSTSIGISDITELAMKDFGMKVSADKGMVSSDQVMFLQRTHLAGYTIDGVMRGIRSGVRTFNGIMHMESINHWPRGVIKYMLSARSIMQLENAAWHPNFHKLVQEYYKRDTLVRELDPATIVKRVGGIGKVEDLLHRKSFPYGTQSGIGFNSFKAVLDIRSLQQQGKSVSH
jgi:hypothetical protein